MQNSIKPMYLLSDSQLLFSKDIDGNYYLSKVKHEFEKSNIKAVYIGASNKDTREFYELFQEGMYNIGISDHYMIKSDFTKTDEVNLENADLILLSGGEVKEGLNIFQKTGIKDIIIKKYYEGTLIIGISAGAIQLGWQTLDKNADNLPDSFLDTLKLIPFIVDVHQENNEWRDLKAVLKISGGMKRGLGIPFGAGIIYYPDQTVEAMRKPIAEFVLAGDLLKETLLLPLNEQLP
ncbi:Type 1 glutamine amidotransferase-like domain-containing protein [Fulvivirgaceae bacterium BMA12]|uniref:Type 1 glutamine amidotransferase-like domain-containing protein n=1 Tax=Agaribacillus aureus TaxID=3051825 RepID=A0ABT8L9S3_9BACT|nr:Type 1 glutamine amidotransferase-like domain-containing protein [Fulvivirgaceae bacterium BMA12]